ncbi:hypothetical protein INS49_007320 [Diaporthe citri]|uniref:uncharacterized protein n=1 Tax=Diaporthe citri TaxID=83186 RepID=UPI001C7FE053|nr:uncharacterized protein INS49_007320 [Diaporthe citri]KAG6365709.1 hypothetical protein INS49_007320 [Diaporthe citri]
MSMAIYTRVYSPSSAGQLVSAKGTGGSPLSDADLLEEFRKHADIENREPTALVSVSERIIDTMKRALDKYYLDGESPADIWVAFVEFPADDTHGSPSRLHPASKLARDCELSNPQALRHETVIEWAIPERNDLRRYVARALQSKSDDPIGFGVFLASFAKKFGARAPLNWTAHQLFHDCIRCGIHDIDPVRLYYAHQRGEPSLVPIEFCLEVEDAIETALYEWWLADFDFVQAYRDYEDWESVMEELILDRQIGFWEAWHFGDHDGTARALSEEEKLVYDTAYDDLLAHNERIRANIEAEAVRIGL